MSSEDRENQKLMEHLFFLFKAIRCGAESQAVKDGLTIPQRIVMNLLARFGDLSVKELSQKIGLSHSTVSGIVDRLERKGLVIRSRDTRDRRITKVSMSEQAKNRHQNSLPKQMFSVIVNAVSLAPAGEQRKIFDGLAALRQLLDKE